MQTRPDPSDQPPPWIEAIVERLIPQTHRVHLLGDLRELYISLPRYILSAAVLVAFVLAGRVRRFLETSRAFEANRVGLLITVIGLLDSLVQPQGAVRTAAPVNRLEFLVGGLITVAVLYWVAGLPRYAAPEPSRRLWFPALFLVLCVLQVCLVLWSAFPGVRTLHLTGWTSVITFLAVSAGVIQHIAGTNTRSQTERQ